MTMLRDGLYVDGDLWDYWRSAFPTPRVSEMFDFVLADIDDDRASLLDRLLSEGPIPPYKCLVFVVFFGASGLCNLFPSNSVIVTPSVLPDKPVSKQVMSIMFV